MTYFLVSTASVPAISKRKEKIRKARNIGELLKIVDAIRAECSSISSVIDRNLINMAGSHKKNAEVPSLHVKVSKGLLISSNSSEDDDEGIRITHTAGKIKPISKIKIQPGSTPSGKKGMFPTSIQDFQHPTAGEVEKILKPVRELQANIAHLDSITSLLTQNFSGLKSKPAAVKHVKDLSKEANNLVVKSLNSLNKSADKTSPPELAKIYDYLEKYVVSTISKKNYSNVYESSYLSKGDTDKDSNYSKYLEFEDLVNAAGFKFDEFFFILTGVIKGSRFEIYLNAMPDFPVPGSYPLGTRIHSYGELESTVRSLLSDVDVLHEVSRRSIPDIHKTKNPINRLKFVKATSIKKDLLRVVLAKKLSKLETEKLDSTIMGIMHNALGLRAAIRLIKKPGNIGKLSYIDYSFYTSSNRSGKPKISATKFDAAADILGLDDSGRQKFKRLLANIENDS